MPEQALLVRTFVDLADNLVDDFDVVDLLSLLADRCVAALDVDAAGVMLAAPSGALQVLASSSDAMRTLELFELQADEGPCLDAFRSGEPVVNVELAAVVDRWPSFAPRAVGDGFAFVHSLPMRHRKRILGAVNLLRSEPTPLAADDIAAAQALADIATIAIVQHQLAVDARTLNDQLAMALNSRVIIEQAKGKIAQSANLDMDQAFRRLRGHARNHNLRLADLAGQIADGTVDPRSIDPGPTGQLRPPEGAHRP